MIPNVRYFKDTGAKPVENTRGSLAAVMAVRSDGEGRMKNMSEESERREEVQVTGDFRFI